MFRRAFFRLLLPRKRPARPEDIAEVRVEPLERWFLLRMKSYLCECRTPFELHPAYLKEFGQVWRTDFSQYIAFCEPLVVVSSKDPILSCRKITEVHTTWPKSRNVLLKPDHTCVLMPKIGRYR